ncbi:flagellar biosynthesis protein FlhF [Nitrosospira briensis]|uniref:Flagellar biosynthesis protein FlhF n=1 Tax=Nitrosospira briensis TaxID=35799 RepID=A0A1I4Y6P5_9PROT|nr:flagellar biosynthesis protein FlhF [Nitrosospira briensis]SFN33675.1 flagellar biosynthesis protein FlhF [Nitrosospira briensis]
MSIKRFFAKTTSEALRMVRDAFGPEGVILSNRAMEGGIEILALSNNDMTALIPSPGPDEAGAAPGTHGKQHVDKGYGRQAQAYAEEAHTDVRNPCRPDFAGSDEKQDQCADDPAGEDDRPISDEASKTIRASSSVAPVLQAAPYTASPEKKRSAEIVVPPNADKAIHAAMPAIPALGKRPRNGRKAPGTVIPDLATPRKTEPSLVDPLQVAGEVAASVLREIRSLRGSLEQQLAALNWNDQERRDPARARLLQRLLMSGFSHSLAHDLLDQLPVEDERNDGNNEKDLADRVKSILTCNLQTIANEGEILEKGGVYALVGPTGVGKTTTTAKLAARCVVRHGADKLALLTTDGYRIGGHEQLRIYGKILGVSVHAVRDTHDLTLALAELRGKHTVLIDTVGMGQRDQMVAEQVAMLAGCGTQVKRLLLLNAASNCQTLNEVAHAYRGDGLAGAIITKLDEAVLMGSALDTAIRHRLPLYYIARGQRVPEDLELADPTHLVSCALDHVASDSPFADAEESFPLVMPGRNSGTGNLDMSGARRG